MTCSWGTLGYGASYTMPSTTDLSVFRPSFYGSESNHLFCILYYGNLILNCGNAKPLPPLLQACINNHTMLSVQV